METLLSGACAAVMLAGASLADDLPRRGLLGVGLGPSEAGVAITSVQDDSPAAAAGFAAGDVLRAIRGRPVSDGLSLQAALAGLPAGGEVEVEILRDGEAVTLTLIPDPVPVPSLDGARVAISHVTLDSGDRIRTFTLTPTEASPLARAAGLPAVYYVQGIPCQSIENLSNPDHYRVRLFRALIDAGFIIGFADKPGIGDSEGAACQDGGFNREIEAFSLAVGQMRAIEGVDADRVYAVGLSMGGIQAPLIDDAGDFDGIVTWGTGATPWFDYIATNFRMRAIIQGQPAAEAEPGLRLLRSMMADLLIDGQSPEDIRAARPEEAASFESSFGSLERFAGRHYTFHQELDRADVWSAWQGFDGQLLAVHGSFDWVATEADHRLAVEAVNRNGQGSGEFVIVPGLDHAMTAHETLADSFANTFQGAQSDAFHDVAVDWLVARAGE
jgi:hypothetical protein